LNGASNLYTPFKRKLFNKSIRLFFVKKYKLKPSKVKVNGGKNFTALIFGLSGTGKSTIMGTSFNSFKQAEEKSSMLKRIYRRCKHKKS